jgi:hypothetical protein
MLPMPVDLFIFAFKVDKTRMVVDMNLAISGLKQFLDIIGCGD